MSDSDIGVAYLYPRMCGYNAAAWGQHVPRHIGLTSGCRGYPATSDAVVEAATRALAGRLFADDLTATT